MSEWTGDELTRIDAAGELQVRSMGPDGTLGKATTIWVVRVGDDLFVRSVRGEAAGWYRGTRARREGRISGGGVTKDVSFEDAGHDLDDRIDRAYRHKYRRHADDIVDTVLTTEARSTTIRLVPRSATS
jgi:hypothetical protein